MRPRIFNNSLQILVALAIPLLAGCGAAASSGDAEQTRGILKVLGLEYGRYLVDHNGTAPPDEAAFRAFLESELPRLGSSGVKSVDDLLKSPRDGQPLQIVVGQKASVADSPDVYWAAYEQTGVADKRLAGNTRGGIAELDAAQLQAATAKK